MARDLQNALNDSLWLNYAFMLVAVAKILSTLIIFYNYDQSCDQSLATWLKLMMFHDVLQICNSRYMLIAARNTEIQEGFLRNMPE